MSDLKQNPRYTCVILSKADAYNCDGILLRLELSWRKNQLAQQAKIKLRNVRQKDKYLNMLLSVRDRVFIYADDGAKREEVFRGFIWTISYSSKKEKELTLTCYDNLIYFQESEDNRYFPSGRDSKTLCQTICDNWGISLQYSYESIAHEKLRLSGSLSDIFLTQILEPVKKKTGKSFVMRSQKDTVVIAPVGQNETVYLIKAKMNALNESSETTMDGMITKIVILGKADEDGQSEVEAVVEGDTALYGTLQKIQNKDENTSLDGAKKEAEETIKEKGKPSRNFEVEAIDIPWIAPGDKVKCEAGDALGEFIVVGISHSIGDATKTMRLSLEGLK